MDDNDLGEFDTVFLQLARRARPGHFEPNCDVSVDREGSALLVTVEIPGADMDQTRIGVDDQHLYITGRRIDPDRERRGAVLRKEIDYGEFSKKIRLPVAVAHELARASYRDGLLSIRIPLNELHVLPEDFSAIPIIVRRTVV
jgi:HSP20 family protein